MNPVYVGEGGNGGGGADSVCDYLVQPENIFNIFLTRKPVFRLIVKANDCEKCEKQT